MLDQFRLAFSTWPIRPLPLAIVSTLFQLLLNFAVVIATARATDTTATAPQYIAILPSLALAFSFGFLSLAAIRGLARWKKSWGSFFYWVGALVFGASLAFARILSINDSTPEYWNEPQSAVRAVLAAALLYYVLHISLGVSSLRLDKQVSAAEAAKASLEVQRGKLIDAQEGVSRQIADFLHDRLQSDLVLLGMQMQGFIEKLNAQDKSIAQAYIDEIERIRQFEVRGVSKQLTPELGGSSLRPAFEDLVGRYSKVMHVQLNLSELGRLTQPVKLACYRIGEQALLNAASHAAAKNVWINIEEIENELKMSVINNGASVPSAPVAGSGFAIIEDWVAKFGGTWDLVSKDGLTELSVSLAF